MEGYISNTGNVLLMGDFNFHIADPADSSARRFLSLIRDTGLYQHVVGLTHVSGHTLDLVFTRPSDYLITSTEVSTLMSDHKWIHVTINQKKKSWPVKVISYRKLKNIDHEEMENNIASSPLVVEPADNIHALAEQYHDTLSSILDQHAPLITQTIRVRPNTPWFNEDIKQAKSERRRRERKWWRTRLATDLIHLKEQRHRVCQMLDSAKATFYHDKIAACGQDSKSLFRLMDNIL